MTVRDVYNYINSFAPFSSAEEWDNSGLLVGEFDAKVKKAVVCLDVTSDEINFAVKENAQLIISHHPVIFTPQKSFLSGNVAFEAAIRGINIISAHTNLDKAPFGVNDTLCEVLEFDFEKAPEDICNGYINIATLSKIMTAKELSVHISEKLGASVRYCDAEKPIKKVAVCSGSGADFIYDALSFGCDAFVTGEASYHKFLDAKASGISLFAAGHYETEIIEVNRLAELLRNEFTSAEFIGFISANTVITEK